MTVHRKFLAATICLSFLMLSSVLALLYISEIYGRPDLSYQTLVRYQQNKVRLGVANTLFIGDSSLGNSIDVKQWQKITGHRATNLALTGVMGYAGSLTMLENALKYASVKNVIIMQTPDMMTRPVADNAVKALQIPETLFDEISAWWQNSVNLTTVAKSVKYLRRYALAKLGFRDEPHSIQIKNDYTAQIQSLKLTNDEPGLAVEDINPDKTNYLNKIAQACAQNNLNCIYVHGPIAEPICQKSKAYFDKIGNMIGSTGITVLNKMGTCIPLNMIGDQPDHVSPLFKTYFTEQYAQMLTPRLND